mgnify:CR=1 FL=1
MIFPFDHFDHLNFDEIYQKHKDYIYMSEHIPYLDDIRGKIWPIINFDYPFGYKWDDITLQDYYMIENDEDLDHKKRLISEHITNVSTDKKLYIKKLKFLLKLHRNY